MGDEEYPQAGAANQGTAPHDCAPQPHPPGDQCKPLPKTTPPKLKKHPKCPSDEDLARRPWGCPAAPTVGPNCLETLIATQTAAINAADQTKKFRDDLTTLLGKAKSAAQEYTRERYDKLVQEWVRQDALIVELIRKLVCAVPCWRAVVDCHVCELLNRLHAYDLELNGDEKPQHCEGDGQAQEGGPSKEVPNSYELRHWFERDLATKIRTLKRIEAVLAAWEKPATTIEKALEANKALLQELSTAVGSDPARAIYDVFFKLVPLHLAIAPPSNSSTKTKIGRAYVDLCRCDEGIPDHYCGPDVGKRSFAKQVIGPQPYLIDPNDYFKVVCCLATERYRDASQAVAEAAAALQKINDRIAFLEKEIEERVKSFEKDAKAAIPTIIHCDDYKRRDGCGPAA